MAKADPTLGKIEGELRRLLTEQGGEGRRTSKRAPFRRFLTQRWDWFQAQHTDNAMTWEGWSKVLTAAGMTNIDGEALSARALKGAYLREAKDRRKAAAKKAAPQPTETAQKPPGPAAGEGRTFRPVGGEKDWTKQGSG